MSNQALLGQKMLDQDQAVSAKWGKSAVISSFLPPSGEYKFFYALKNARTMRLEFRDIEISLELHLAASN